MHGTMYGKRWFSFKHNAWAVVTDELQTRHGYYTIEFPDLGIFRRYNAERILREIEAQNTQIDTQLGVTKHRQSETVSAGAVRHHRPNANSAGVVSTPISAQNTEATPSSASNAVLEYSPWTKTTKHMGTLINLVFAWKD